MVEADQDAKEAAKELAEKAGSGGTRREVVSRSKEKPWLERNGRFQS